MIEWMYLYENDITGRIPSSFGNLISVGELNTEDFTNLVFGVLYIT